MLGGLNSSMDFNVFFETIFYADDLVNQTLKYFFRAIILVIFIGFGLFLLELELNQLLCLFELLLN